MRLFVYEFVTGGGCHSWPSSPRPDGSLLAEAAAMIDSLSADLRAEGHEVKTLRDARLGPPRGAGTQRPAMVADAAAERRFFCRAAAAADGVIVVAPELDGALQRRAEWALDAGGRLLSPDPAWIAVAADKRRCAAALRAAGVPTVATYSGEQDAPLPLLSKPRDGCGSLDLQLVHSQAEARRHWARGRQVERIADGWPASVAVLCGPGGNVVLPPCQQHLGTGFRYLGGRLPLGRAAWERRAQQLALRAVRALGPATGYVGVDLLLGEHGAGDLAVEINPRMTTSYVGLRTHCRGVAGAMLAVACGRPVQLAEERPRVRFTASGECELESA